MSLLKLSKRCTRLPSLRPFPKMLHKRRTKFLQKKQNKFKILQFYKLLAYRETVKSSK